MKTISDFMKLWIDDVREAPTGYTWCKSVNETINLLKNCFDIEVVDLDHDAGDYSSDGGDFIKVLDYMVENNLNYPVHIHSMNPVGVENMRRLLRRFNIKEI